MNGTTGGGGGAGSGQAGSWGANTGAASTSDDEAPVPVQVKDWLSRSMTTVASSASVGPFSASAFLRLVSASHSECNQRVWIETFERTQC